MGKLGSFELHGILEKGTGKMKERRKNVLRFSQEGYSYKIGERKE